MEPSGVMMRSLLLDEEEEEASPSGASSSVDRRRVEEEVGRTRVAVVVVRRSGMSSRPMLPEAEVMRIVVGGMFPCWCVVLCCVMVFLFRFCFCFCFCFFSSFCCCCYREAGAGKGFAHCFVVQDVFHWIGADGGGEGDAGVAQVGGCEAGGVWEEAVEEVEDGGGEEGDGDDCGHGFGEMAWEVRLTEIVV